MLNILYFGNTYLNLLSAIFVLSVILGSKDILLFISSDKIEAEWPLNEEDSERGREREGKKEGEREGVGRRTSSNYKDNRQSLIWHQCMIKLFS